MKKTSSLETWHRTRCVLAANSHSTAAPGSTDELAEEVRQLRAAVSVYRHVAERLMEERRK